MSYQSRKTQAIINLTALKHNYQQIAALAPSSLTIAVIKANAYGHGANAIAKSLDSIVPALAVAFIDEALSLRAVGITSPILILEGPLCAHDFTIANEENFWLMLHNPMQINWLTNCSAPHQGKLWLKVDTGMNRLGFMPEDITKIIAALTTQQTSNLVLCTHFSSADESDNPKTMAQISALNTLAQEYQCQLSFANSAGILNWPQSHSDFNRLGLALYGASPNAKDNLPVKLRPVMTLQSTIIALRTLNKGDKVGYGETWQAQRPSLIATIAIGYADGYPRNAKAGTPVWVNGQLAPIVGQVSMDMITIDVTKVKQINIGDVVELWGNKLTVETVAEHMDTINYELLTRVSARVPKKYIS